LAAEKAAKPAPSPAAPPAQAKRKLSFKERHALETLPKEIEKLQAEIKAITQALNDPNLYARDPAGFAEKSKALVAAETRRDAAELQWLELEELRETLEG
jgi:ATP-binding cassette subfamily F protein uup